MQIMSMHNYLIVQSVVANTFKCCKSIKSIIIKKNNAKYLDGLVALHEVESTERWKYVQRYDTMAGGNFVTMELDTCAREGLRWGYLFRPLALIV